MYLYKVTHESDDELVPKVVFVKAKQAEHAIGRVDRLRAVCKGTRVRLTVELVCDLDGCYEAEYPQSPTPDS